MITDGLNISTGQNSGQAQQFRPFDYSYVDRQEAQRQREEQAKQASQSKNVSDLSKQLQSLNKLDIFYRDQPVFQKKNKELWDFANKNIRNVRNGDTGTKLQLDQMVADLENEAQLSKADKESYVKMNESLAANGKEANLRPESRDYLVNFASPDNAGKYGFDASQVKYNQNLGEWVNKELVPIAKMQSEKGKSVSMPDEKGIVTTYKRHEFTPTEAEELVKHKLTSDPIALEQAVYDFSKATPQEQEQYKDPVTFAAKKLAPDLVIKDNESDIKHIGDGQGGFQLNIGGNTAENNKWRFTGETKEIPNPEYTKYENMPVLVKAVNKAPSKTIQEQVVKVQSLKSPNENPPHNIVDPRHKGKTFLGVLDNFTKTPDGKVVFNFVNKENNKIVSVPEEEVTAEVKNDIGYDAKEIFGTGITKTQNATIEKGGASEVKRKTKDGKVAIFDANTKKFLRYE